MLGIAVGYQAMGAAVSDGPQLHMHLPMGGAGFLMGRGALYVPISPQPPPMHRPCLIPQALPSSVFVNSQLLGFQSWKESFVILQDLKGEWIPAHKNKE